MLTLKEIDEWLEGDPRYEEFQAMQKEFVTPPSDVKDLFREMVERYGEMMERFPEGLALGREYGNKLRRLFFTN